MNRFFFSARFLAAAALAATALGAATVAEARPNVVVSIGLPIGPAWVEPAPVYLPPPPLFAPPLPVFARPPLFVSPRPVFERPRWSGYDARYRWEREHGGRRIEWRGHDRQHHRFGDGDRDHRDHGRQRGHRD